MNSKVIQFSRQGNLQTKTSASSLVKEDYLYTLDMIINDAQKDHYKEHCVVCEPMKLMGTHRDRVITEMAGTMVGVFFEDFTQYCEDVKGIVLEKLLRRDAQGRIYPTIQARFNELILEQLEVDIQDFVVDIEKHLLKYTQSNLSAKRKEMIVKNTLKMLKKNWINF
ncbi:MAG: hypothetical protein HYU97_10290 [Deltaproteobacteria bacterium]|nr:hypothetical protein [Deltaproteobacteria bacterium]